VFGPESRLTEEIAYLKLQYRHFENCYVIHEPLYNITLQWRFQEKAGKFYNIFRQFFESGIYPAFVRNDRGLKKTIKTISWDEAYFTKQYQPNFILFCCSGSKFEWLNTNNFLPVGSASWSGFFWFCLQKSIISLLQMFVIKIYMIGSEIYSIN